MEAFKANSKKSAIKDNKKGRGISPINTGGSVDLLNDVANDCKTKSRSREALELSKLLKDPFIEALLDTHDTVATKYEGDNEPISASTPVPSVNGNSAEAIRMVGLRKPANEPLGVTVRIENGELIVARILGGGLIEKQGLLHVGDVIREVNGHEVVTPEQLQDQVRRAPQGNITFKIVPGFDEYQAVSQSLSRRFSTRPPKPGGAREASAVIANNASSPRTVRKLATADYVESVQSSPTYYKALYSYDPENDSLIPCAEIGLAFKQGEVLQILSMKDPNWWQAKKIGSNGPAGLIPSQELEERRQAYVRPEFDYATKTSMCGTRIMKRKKKQMYLSHHNTEFDKAELILYEEVARMPPFERKTLVLIGAQGVGRRTLKNRLIAHDPERFSTTMPHTSKPIESPDTSRPPRGGEEEGRGYHFTTRDDMEEDIQSGKYLEFGEFNGHLYGTQLDSVRSVIRMGKMCVLDSNPQALKSLNTPEFLPFVVFIATPGMEHLRQFREQKTMSSAANLTFDRAVGRSRRARTLESLASLIEDEELKRTMDESGRIHRMFEKYFDLILINEDMNQTFRQLMKALNALSVENQWVPVSWVY